jgi:hypothetical protein
VLNLGEEKKVLEIYCKKCKNDHTIKIDANFLDGKTNFPVKYSYLHKDPRFIMTLFIDKQFKVRGIETSDYYDPHQEDDTIISTLCERFDDNYNIIAELDILNLRFSFNGRTIKEYLETSWKTGIEVKKIMKNHHFIRNNLNFNEYYFQYEDYWFAGTAHSKFLLEIVVSSKTGIESLHNMIHFIFKHFFAYK